MMGRGFGIGIGLFLMVMIITTTTRVSSIVRNSDVTDKLNASDAGRFALHNLQECLNTKGGFLGMFESPKSEPECVNVVVTAARNRKGNEFAAEVGKDLDIWLMQKNRRD